MSNPFLTGEDKTMFNDDDEGSDAEQAKENKIHRQKMEEEGFTIVTQDEQNKSRTKGRDQYDNVVSGITQEEAQ